MDGLLILQEMEKNLVLLERGFGLTNQDPASITALVGDDSLQ
jgi:hypothetical protein